MRRNVLALMMIAIMSLTVCGTVIVATSQKATASSDAAPIVVHYQPGAKYIFTPTQFKKYDSTEYSVEGTPVHHATAVGGTAMTMMRASSSQHVIDNSAFVGVTTQLDQDWRTISSQPCTVTMHLSYHATAHGASVAKVRAVATDAAMPFFEKDAFGNVQGLPRQQSGTTTVTYQTTIAGLYRFGPQLDGVIVTVGSYNTGSGSANSGCHLDYITLEFPQAQG